MIWENNVKNVYFCYLFYNFTLIKKLNLLHFKYILFKLILNKIRYI
jgi:hypothetical protein